MQTQQTNRLYKKQKLCSATAIDALFSRESADDLCSCLAFPLRAVWRTNGARSFGASLQFLISVPKRRLRHAVDRVKMRRRIREAYRLAQHSISMPEGDKMDVAFVYVASDIQPYAKVECAVGKILAAIEASRRPCEAPEAES